MAASTHLLTLWCEVQTALALNGKPQSVIGMFCSKVGFNYLIAIQTDFFIRTQKNSKISISNVKCLFSVTLAVPEAS